MSELSHISGILFKGNFCDYCILASVMAVHFMCLGNVLKFKSFHLIAEIC